MKQYNGRFRVEIADLNNAEVRFWQNVQSYLVGEDMLVHLLDVDAASENIDHHFAGITIELDDNKLIITGNEHGDAEFVARILRSFLNEYALGGMSRHEPIILQASTCDGDQYGGVAFYITPQGYQVLSTADIGTGVLVPHNVLTQLRTNFFGYGESVASLNLVEAIRVLFNAIDGERK
jgi:hypothetical protein